VVVEHSSTKALKPASVWFQAKSITATIAKEPARFFAYNNNGIQQRHRSDRISGDDDHTP